MEAVICAGRNGQAEDVRWRFPFHTETVGDAARLVDVAPDSGRHVAAA